MGTAYNDNSGIGLIPQVMNALFNKIETLKHQTEFQLHVSFIEVFVHRYAQYCQILKDAAFF
jgi:kinesin family protein 4/21/27